MSRPESERLWHDPSFVTKWERQRNLRYAHKRCRERDDGGEYHSPEREADLAREQRYARSVGKPAGDPSRAVPLAFDKSGKFVPSVAHRIPPRQAKQAVLLAENGLVSKARRQAWCGVIGRPLDCISGNPSHRFFKRCRCGLRYCFDCGPLCFRGLFNRHVRLRPVAEELLQHRLGDHRPRVLAKLDITTRNLGRMPTASEVRRFHEDVRRLFRELELQLGISRSDYGFLWCSEFGKGNSNLHAHGLYCGPWIPQKKLSRIWAEIRGDGSFIVSIKPARSFEAALGHCLKYPSKFFDAPPARLVELELALHRVRRVHALARFYNPKIQQEPGEDEFAEAGHCPTCGDLLGEPKRGWAFVDQLVAEGRRDLDEVRLEPSVRQREHSRRLENALAVSGPSPP